MIIDTPVLHVPHIDMENRDFVLIPLTELAPYYRHPVLNKTISQLLKELAAEDKLITAQTDKIKAFILSAWAVVSLFPMFEHTDHFSCKADSIIFNWNILPRKPLCQCQFIGIQCNRCISIHIAEESAK